MTQRIAIILARGGSKRLPRKNVMPFGGRPMLAWSVGAALDSGCFQRVLVSTDDEEIAQAAIAAGAEVPFLRDRAADDQSPSSAATRIALEQAETYWNERYDVVAQLMANCPLRNADDVRAGVTHFHDSGAPSQISAFKFGWMNPWWAVKLAPDGQPDWVFPEARQSRSQDLPSLYCPTGALWLAQRDAFVGGENFYLPGHIFFPMDWTSAVDIDDAADLAMAEACFALRQRHQDAA
ncbi:acylneuraminate cytidylyltransferase family protein [Denitromonas ohlonensis]|uniref:acylneuraminate cytidylyltransferase family protein n=1 Tax=Denitromonas ohlonensis TaxID=3078508 RepID=UPI001C9027E6|nr:acylneuraminate cytidylyltransferase family protein [Denitromonas ohlonensis]